jgi:pimeloyl-ACP methyl ester carboxylesterase
VTSATLPHPVLAWDEPDGIAPRATLILLTGRGEPPAVYGRTGRRLSSDAYRVRAVETRLDDLAATRADVLAQLEDAIRPAVLIGADAGAAVAARLAGELDVDALIVAGLAVGAGPAVTWEEELEARTACPAHRAVLAGEARRGALAEQAPEAPGPPAVPTLVIHGAADPLTEADAAFAAFPRARTALVDGAHHDVLNDVSHRSVAATIVLFLERLRLGPELPAIVT